MNLERLAGFPQWLREVTTDVPAVLAATRPAAGGFALVEHFHHLADLEREGYAERIMRIPRENEPSLADFPGDEIARTRRYIERDAEGGLQRFTEARAQNIARLEAIMPEQWELVGIQDGVGRVTLARVVEMMEEHDAMHAAEIEALVLEIAGKASETFVKEG